MTDLTFGQVVLVEATGFDGTTYRELLPAAAAVVRVLADPRNGVTIARARIVWGGVLDEWPLGYGHGA